jgi:hypothetical protein
LLRAAQGEALRVSLPTRLAAVAQAEFFLGLQKLLRGLFLFRLEREEQALRLQ